MPTYDYECENCGYKFEVFHTMSAKPLTDCPECHQSKLIKLIGMGSAAIVKGTTTPCKGGRSNRKPISKMDKLGEGINKSEKPFWRDGPVNKQILKNPEKYIKTGEI